MKKVLLAVDGSESCNKAIREVAELANNLELDVTIISIVEENVAPQIDSQKHAEREIAIQESAEKRAESITKSCGELFDDPESINKIIEQGNPAKVICRVAGEGDYDLVVVADMGKSAIKKFMLGSTTEKVVRYCSKSVLVVK